MKADSRVEDLGITDTETSTAPAPPRRKLGLGLDRFSGLYVWAALIVLFGILRPDTFLTPENARIIAAEQAITAMIALAVVVALAAGVFDLSVAATLGVSVCVVITLQSNGYNPVVAALAAVLTGIVIGFVNGFIVVKLHVESLIATLGMSSILAAVAFWITGGKQIVTGISPSFLAWGRESVLGLPAPVYYMAVTALVLWYVLEYTPVGRNLYAVGGNPVAARLAGVRVDRITWGALVVTAAVAAIAGVVLAARLGSATPEVGPGYLLPAFSAAFLGATQIKRGRMNVLGTLVAIFLLATGIKGLQLIGAPSYVNFLFNGLALIIAVALAVRTTRHR
jgi:ribose transport system permease protein